MRKKNTTSLERKIFCLGKNQNQGSYYSNDENKNLMKTAIVQCIWSKSFAQIGNDISTQTDI